MKITFFAVLLLVLSVSTMAQASQIEVQARAYSATQCQYFTTGIGDFRLTYANDQLAAGSHVILHGAFRDESKNQNWTKSFDSQMNLVSPGQWKSDLAGLTIVERGAYYASSFEFIFEIIAPDEKHSFENGGRDPFGHYAALLQILTTECQPGTYQTLSVQPFGPYDATERAH